ncbi:MAG: flagellar biosynthetic protein FliR, partial [Granulosicoccaceae bacterium]
PVGLPDINPQRALVVAAWASQMFGMAVLASIPVVATLLLIYVALGVMTRAAPQLNIFSVGFPLTIFAGFVALV